MSHIADRIASKITRAKQHLSDLQLAISAFRDSKPYKVGIKEDAGQRIYYAESIECIPTDVTNIAADVIQNLRSPLDQIVSQLMAAGGADEAALKQAEYPIRDLAAHYPSARGRIAKHLGEKAIETIDATEPYKGGKGHVLWQLNALNNPDKHHFPLAAKISNVSVDVSGDFAIRFSQMPGFENVTVPPIFIASADKREGSKAGDHLYIEPLEKKMVPNRQFTLEVTFDERGIIECEPALKFLHDATNLVGDIVTRLGKFLP
jgi:hypothetical protein